jgi:hypothetical protein
MGVYWTEFSRRAYGWWIHSMCSGRSQNVRRSKWQMEVRLDCAIVLLGLVVGWAPERAEKSEESEHTADKLKESTTIGCECEENPI